MKKLKMESLKSQLAAIILCLFVGAVLLSVSNLFAEKPDPRYLHNVPRDELEGAYVTVDLDYIYGCYAYTEEYEDNRPTGRITKREYLIDANEADFMCVILSGDLMEKAEALLEESDALYYGEIDEITTNFTVTGRVERLPVDSIEFLHDAVDYDALTPEEQDIYLPLYLKPVSYDIEPISLIIGLGFLAVAAILAILCFTGRYQRQVQDKLLMLYGANSSGMDEMMNYLLSLPSVKGLRIGQGYLLMRAGARHILLDSNDLIWAYQQTTTQKLYGIIPTGKTYALMLSTAEGKQYTLPMSQKQVQQSLSTLMSAFPTTAIGYSDQLRALYNSNDRGMLRQVAAHQHSQN